jgi:predicted kinase
MSKIIILCGISGSGKSTFASTTVRHNPERYIVVNRDKLREAHYGYLEDTISEYYSRNDFNYLENQITAVQDNLISFWLKRGKDVIVDATNLRIEYQKNFEKFKVPTEVVYFDVTLKEALTRNMGRKRKVDESIIEKQYQQYCNLKKL